MPENVFPTPTPPVALLVQVSYCCAWPFKGSVLSPCRLVWPPKLLPRQAWPGPQGKKLRSVYKLGRGGILRSTASSGPGVALPWQVSLAVKAGSQSVPDPRSTWWETLETGHSSSVLPSHLWASSPSVCDGPDDTASWPKLLEPGGLPLFLEEVPEAQGHRSGEVTVWDSTRPSSSKFSPKATKEPWVAWEASRDCNCGRKLLTQPTFFQWETVHLTPVETSVLSLMSTCLCK